MTDKRRTKQKTNNELFNIGDIFDDKIERLNHLLNSEESSIMMIVDDKSTDVLKVADSHYHDNTVLDENIFGPCIVFTGEKKSQSIILMNEMSLFSFYIYPRSK
jgi:hypothetical protein